MSVLKISWGTRIFILFLGFVTIVVSLVVGSMRQTTELVSEDYYKQELAYQNVLDAAKNQATLTAPVEYTINNHQLELQFPEQFKHTKLEGVVTFYAAANSSWDKKMNIQSNTGATSIDITTLQPTQYIMKISWNADGKNYYQENKISVKG